MNVFQKYLRRQVGNRKYSGYVEICRRDFEKNDISHLRLDSKPIFDDMYEFLKEENADSLKERMTELIDTMMVASRITRQFAFVMLTYLAANFVLLVLNLNYYVTCVSIVLIGVCFLYKLVEFVNNKHCVLDAYLFAIYKLVLQKIAKELS